MEGSASRLQRDSSRDLRNDDEVGGGRRSDFPYNRGGVKAEPQTARFFRITFPEKGKPVLNIGPGDHSVQRWNLTMEDIKGLVKDVLPELLP